MSKTTQGASAAITTNVLTKQLWIEKMFREQIVESYFMPRFAGDGENNMVQTNTDLSKTRGDRMYFGIDFKLTGAGITGAGTLEGNEEKISDSSWTIYLEQYRHAVRDDGAMSRQRKLYDIDAISKDRITSWGGEKIDSLIFDALGPGTGAQYLYQTSGTNTYSVTQATAEAAVTSADKLNLDFLSFLKTFAKTGHGRDFNPIQPVKVDGKEYYILLVHPDCLYDLRVDSQFQQAMREAQVRGDSNPLFKGATALWDGVVIHEHERVPTKVSGDGSYTTNAAECYFLGKQAVVWAWGERPSLVNETFDYGNEHGYAWSMIAKADTPYFTWPNGSNYRNGSLIVPMARTAISDIAAS